MRSHRRFVEGSKRIHRVRGTRRELPRTERFISLTGATSLVFQRLPFDVRGRSDGASGPFLLPIDSFSLLNLTPLAIKLSTNSQFVCQVRTSGASAVRVGPPGHGNKISPALFLGMFPCHTWLDAPSSSARSSRIAVRL